MSAALDVAVRGTRRAQPGLQLRGVARSASLWIVLVAVLLVLVAVMGIMTTDEDETRPLHYSSYAKDGTHAFAAVLSEHARASTTSSFAEASAAAKQKDTTVVVLNPDALPAKQAAELSSAGLSGGTLVLVKPTTALPQFTRDITRYTDLGKAPGRLRTEPGCRLPAAERAGAVTEPAELYIAAHSTAVCYGPPKSSRQGGLVTAEHGAGTLIVAGSEDWFMNSGFADEGNAALALGLAGSTEKTVLYWADENAFADDESAPPSLADLLPDWVRYAGLWLAVFFIVVFLWRGRRFGPLAVEALPAVVPGRETIYGRAGLMQSARARTEALRSIQQSAIIALARRLGIPASTPAIEVCRAAAARLGQSPEALEHLLLSAVPATDAELVRLAQAIADLERQL